MSRSGQHVAVTLGLGALGLSACAMGPRFRHPEPGATLGYGEAAQTSIPADPGAAGGEQRLKAGAVVEARWWTLFGSPELDRLVDQALKNSSDLAAAEAALRAAHQNTLAQSGALLPTVDAGASTSRNKSSTYLSPVLGVSQYYYSLQTAQVSVSYAADVFGGVRRQIEAARASEDQQRYQFEAVRQTLIANLVAAALNEAALRAEIAAQIQVVAENQRILAVIRDQAAKGQVAQQAIAVQEGALAQAQAALPPLQRARAQARDLIAYLVGVSPGEASPPNIDLATLTLPHTLPLSLPAALVRQRPDILQAEANLHAASAQVGVAIAARLPAFTLTALAGGASSAWSNLLSSSDSEWSLGAGVVQPIFEGGLLYRRQKAAEAQLDQAKSQYRSAVLAALQNVADTLTALRTDASGLDAAASGERAATDNLEITRRQLDRGQVTDIELLTAEQAELQARQSLIQAESARFTDTAALFEALGGGWWSDAES